MALFLSEDSKKVTKKKIPIPKNTKKIFKAMKSVYKSYLDKNYPGSKILKSLGSDREYNKKGKNSHLNGNGTRQDYVSVEDAKVRLHRMNKLPKNSIEYQLNGGELAANLYRKGIQQARGVKKVDAVQPPKPTANISPDVEINTKEMSVPNGKITFNMTSEGRIINEVFSDEHPYFDYLEDYDVNYVFNSFLSNKNGKQSWGVLINPDMYKKALSEFTRFGKLTNFPKKYVYQWMGIIMKNTAILKANTDIAGHGYSFPSEEFEEFVHNFFNDERDITFKNEDDELIIQISLEDMIKLCNNDFKSLKESVDKSGQEYFPWVSQEEADDIWNNDQKRKKFSNFDKNYGDIRNYIEKFNQKSQYGDIEFDEDAEKIYWITSYWQFLESIGFYEWMSMPDGSDAFSDYGLEPLEKIISEYNEELPAEKVLVIVNKALDVYHQRGDLSSIFIQGGSTSLTRISENKNKRKRKIYINERQLIRNGKHIK